MEAVMLILGIVSSVVLVGLLKDEVGKFFYYLIILSAFALENLFSELTHSVYIASIDVYLDVNMADGLYYGILLVNTVVCVIVGKGRKSVKTLLMCSTMPLAVFLIFNSKVQLIWMNAALFMGIVVLLLFFQAVKRFWCEKKKGVVDVKKSFCRLLVAIQKRFAFVVMFASVLCVCMTFAGEKLRVAEAKVSMDLWEADRSLPEDAILRMKAYDSLTVDERLELIREIIKCETDYLGIKSDEYVVTMNELPEGTGGWYDDSQRVIVLDNEVICDELLEVVLETSFHEVFHLYQHEVVRCIDWSATDNSNLLVVRQALRWKYENDNYKTPGGVYSYEDYYNQSVESSARAYGKEISFEYMELLNE